MTVRPKQVDPRHSWRGFFIWGVSMFDELAVLWKPMSGFAALLFTLAMTKPNLYLRLEILIFLSLAAAFLSYSSYVLGGLAVLSEVEPFEAWMSAYRGEEGERELHKR